MSESCSGRLRTRRATTSALGKSCGQSWRAASAEGTGYASSHGAGLAGIGSHGPCTMTSPKSDQGVGEEVPSEGNGEKRG